MSFSLPPTLKPATAQRLADLRHWSDLLCSSEAVTPLEVHIYVDGSWHEQLQVGGYAVAILLVTKGSAALFGVLAWGTDPREPAHALDVRGGPGAQNGADGDHGGIVVVLAESVLPCPGGVFSLLRLRCCRESRGWGLGQWPDFGLRTRAVFQLFCDSIDVPAHICHVKAHNDDPYNELVDTVAKAAARGTTTLCAPPATLCAMVQTADFYVAASCGAATATWCFPYTGRTTTPVA